MKPPLYRVKYCGPSRYPCRLKIKDSQGVETRCGQPAAWQVKYHYQTPFSLRYWERWACESCARGWARQHRIHFPERKDSCVNPIDRFGEKNRDWNYR